jgi:surface antigen
MVIGLMMTTSMILPRDAQAFSINDIGDMLSNFILGKEIAINSNPIIEPVIVKIPNVKNLGPTKKRIFLPGDENPKIAGQCVGFVKYVTGIDYSGNASEWVAYINSDSPSKYSIAVISAGRWGHIGLVVDDNYSDGKVTIRSRNWEGLWIISDDEFDTNDTRILGYITYEN